MTLVEFLLARIAEDEADARACKPESERHPYGDRTIPATPFDRLGPEIEGYLGGPLGAHAARWHPAHVLAECEAKRRIIDIHAGNEHLRAIHARMPTHWDGYCQVCEDGLGRERDEIEHQPMPCPTLRALALPYADRPEFDEEWLP